MIKLRFNKPTEIYAYNDYSGKKYKFPYTIKYVTSGPELDKEVQHQIIISITNLLLKRWSFQNEDDLLKIFFLRSNEFIKNKLIEGNLNEIEKLDLDTNTLNEEIEYDPQKIDDFVDKIYTFDLDELKRDRNKFKMGF